MKRRLSKLFGIGLVVIVLLAIPLIVFWSERSRLRDVDAVLDAARRESAKHVDGGFLADKSVVEQFEEKEHHYTGGRYENESIKYRLRSPKRIVSGKEYPLVVWLHGKGESGDDNMRQLAHIQAAMEFLDGENELDFFMIATQCPKDNREWTTSVSSEGKGDAPLTITGEILDVVLQKYPVDRNRIGLVGICSGGGGTWPLLKMKPNFFSGVAVFSTAPPTDFDWNEYCQHTSLWAFTNLDDTSVSTPDMKHFINGIKHLGGAAWLTTRETGGHDSWGPAMRSDKVIAWLVLQDREKFSPPPGIVLHLRNDWTKPTFYFSLPLGLILGVLVVRVRQWTGRKEAVIA